MAFFSFAVRQKSLDSQRHIRRLVDLTVPNNEAAHNSGRYEKRYNRAIPVLICPVRDGQPDLDRAIFAITKDLADRGAGILTRGAAIALEEAIISFWVQDSPWFFHGFCRTHAAIGGGFWLNGFELSEFIEAGSNLALARLGRMARELSPPDVFDRLESLVREALE